MAKFHSIFLTSCYLHCFQVDHPDITFGTALILKLQRMAMHGDFKAEEENYFRRATDSNSPAAAFFNLMDAIAVNEVDIGFCLILQILALKFAGVA